MRVRNCGSLIDFEHFLVEAVKGTGPVAIKTGWRHEHAGDRRTSLEGRGARRISRQVKTCPASGHWRLVLNAHHLR
jgi:hypothetical protein